MLNLGWGCNFLSRECFCSKETLEENLAQDAPRVYLCYKNTYARAQLLGACRKISELSNLKYQLNFPRFGSEAIDYKTSS